MHKPVLCAHCRSVYDLGAVEPDSRREDGAVWVTPCCDVLVTESAWPPGRHYRALILRELREINEFGAIMLHTGVMLEVSVVDNNE